MVVPMIMDVFIGIQKYILHHLLVILVCQILVIKNYSSINYYLFISIALPTPLPTESVRSTSVSSSISTEFGAITNNNNNSMIVPSSPRTRRMNRKCNLA